MVERDVKQLQGVERARSGRLALAKVEQLQQVLTVVGMQVQVLVLG
jgi:hypothetical protein